MHELLVINLQYVNWLQWHDMSRRSATGSCLPLVSLEGMCPPGYIQIHIQVNKSSKLGLLLLTCCPQRYSVLNTSKKQLI